MEITIRSHAKINLQLRVLGLRPDGYHELRTILQTLELHDVLRFVPSRGPLRISSNCAGVPTDRTNLVWRAAAALWTHLGRRGEPIDLAIHINKKIPLQAGLGGGSSNAAATLVALTKLWGARVALADLAPIGASLGADVPFFLAGGTALGLNRGDELFPLQDVEPYDVVLLIPDFGVSTAAAYGWWDREVEPERKSVSGVHISPWPTGGFELANDLEPVVVQRHPQIAEMEDALREAGAASTAMSGTGSAVFGLFGPGAGAAVTRKLRRIGRWTVLGTCTISRSAFLRQSRPNSKRP